MADGDGKFYNVQPKWMATDQIDGVLEYLKAIDWTEKWLIFLMILHILVFMIIILNRNRTNILAFVFVFLLMCVYFSEKLNQFAAKNWRLFASEQYFDSPGLFMSVIFSTPILFNSLVIIVIWLWESSKTMSVITKHRRRIYQNAQHENRKTCNETKSVEMDKKAK
ncbi:transmembrane protein 18-like [Xenia sp. Carnegie-2017]|uniref:transmembrane protein 18-like n=1 Tax=Xenia sp. Carnegie-2017 TaxID=2897299 RepID=UPI001F04B338|nr:transmembrane protein 18-like [Xenia sp. Carnegie-2017]